MSSFFVKLAGVLLSCILASAAEAACQRENAVATRTLTISPATTRQVGVKSYPSTLPLQDREVVLTFDDGPWPGTTMQVLAALEQSCVSATFFLIGQNAQAHPDLVKKILAKGHSIGHHSMTHPLLRDLPLERAIAEITEGMSADDRAAYGHAGAGPLVPWFRFPGFADSPALLDWLAKRQIVVFGTDFWASDWNPMTPDQQLKLVIQRLEQARRGIILFHDTKAQTAAMLPAFLQYLQKNDYKVVHMVPETGNALKTAQ